jgi:two-component system chemotaxis sensor kinase CheA
VVDQVNDTEEIVVKPLGQHLKGITAFAGATIMGDGRVALILDVGALVRLSRH